MEMCEEWWSSFEKSYNSEDDAEAIRFIGYMYTSGCLELKKGEDESNDAVQQKSGTVLSEITSCSTLIPHIVRMTRGKRVSILRIDNEDEITRQLCQTAEKNGSLGRMMVGRQEWMDSCASMGRNDGVRTPACHGYASTSNGKMEIPFWREKYSDGDDLLGYSEFHLM